jgi:hypothetical protein
MSKSISRIDKVSWILRIALVVVFLYAAASSLMHPLDWVSYLPTFLTKHIAATTLLKIFAVYEILLAVWLIMGKWLKYCALLCAATLAGIVLMNPSQLLVTFRDIGLTLTALALAVANW